MSTITSLNIWKDVGFTEGCLEAPSKTSSLPASSFTFSNLNVSRDRLFSEVQVPGSYENLYDCSYLKAVYDMNNGDDVTVYGWIDEVICSSDTAQYPMTRIVWHIDYWRTYLASAVFKGGIVKRRPTSADIPAQKYPYRYMEYSDWYDVLMPSGDWCVIFNFNTSDTTRTPTDPPKVTLWGCYPVSLKYPANHYTVSDGKGTSPSLMDTLQGKLDEFLGLDPSAINSIWLSPAFPNTYTDVQNLAMDGWYCYENFCNGRCLVNIHGAAFSFGVSYKRSLVTDGNKRLPSAVATDDDYVYTLCDMQGYAVGTLPWGMKFSYLYFWLVVSTDSAYIRFAFLDGQPTASEEADVLTHAVAEGRVFTAPCIPLGLSSNDWSAYVYSGAREVEREQRRLTTQQTMENGVAGTATSGISGAASGAMMGAIGGPLGMLGGALLGGITSAFTQGVNTATNYAISTKYNDKFNDLSDYAHAHQTSVNLLPSGSYDPLNNDVGGFRLVKTKKDDYSITQRASDIAMYGAHVEEPTASCQSLIDAGGPIQIQNLTVTGSIPVAAKDYFRNIFARGVRII